MKKRICALLAIVMALSLVLAACGGPAAPAPTQAPPAAPADPGTPATQAPAPVDDKVYEFTLTNHDAPTGATGRQLELWAKTIGEASNGRIKINLFHGGSLGPPNETFNMVKDRVADIGWGLASFYPGVFPATEVISLPFMGVKSAKQGSYALWDLYQSNDVIKNEWNDVHVLVIHTNCDAPMLTKTKLEKVEDFKGMNVRIIGGPPTEWAKLVGANPMNILLGEIYTSMEKGVISGITSTGWDVVNSFKFYEQGPFVLDYAIHVNACFLVMNKDSYNTLPDDLKAIMDQYSGYGALEVLGDIRDLEKVDVAGKIVAAGGEIYTLPAAEQAKVEEFGAQARQIWIDNMKGKGIEADGLVKNTLDAVAAHKDKAPQ